MVEENGDKEVEGKQPESGIGFRPASGRMEPPLAGGGEGEPGEIYERPEAGPEMGAMRQGKVPLHPAMIRLPFSVIGRVLTELTQYPGFTFTDQELNDLAELWIQCGIVLDPRIQAAVGTTSMVGAKALGYFAWVKAGRPEIKYGVPGTITEGGAE